MWGPERCQSLGLELVLIPLHHSYKLLSIQAAILEMLIHKAWSVLLHCLLPTKVSVKLRHV